MSDQPTKRTVPASLGDADKLPRKIPLRFVKFTSPTDIPGESVCERVKVDPKQPEGQKRWTANYLPAMDTIEIFYHPSDQRQPVEVGYVHASQTKIWLPAL